jgi:hypothetical protein
MGVETVADDWQCVAAGQGGFGLLLAGSLFVFHSYSKKADFGARQTGAAGRQFPHLPRAKSRDVLRWIPARPTFGSSQSFRALTCE